jgi:hypothetical protein
MRADRPDRAAHADERADLHRRRVDPYNRSSMTAFAIGLGTLNLWNGTIRDK